MNVQDFIRLDVKRNLAIILGEDDPAPEILQYWCRKLIPLRYRRAS